jgi:hypothetical protein
MCPLQTPPDSCVLCGCVVRSISLSLPTTPSPSPFHPPTPPCDSLSLSLSDPCTCFCLGVCHRVFPLPPTSLPVSMCPCSSTPRPPPPLPRPPSLTPPHTHRWDDMCTTMGVQDKTLRADWWRKLRSLYMGPGRFYHTLRHLDELFEKVCVVCASACMCV